MSSDSRAVIYVESGTSLSGLASLRPMEKDGSGKGPSPSGESNYVIKIQIGEETMYNPVCIDVSQVGKMSRSMASLKESPCDSGGGDSDNPSPLLDEGSSSSGQSSPRSDMTPPPRINSGAANRFGSETSESDTESDISSAEFRPLSCQAAQFAMREICEVETPSPPLPRSIMKKPGNTKVPPLPSSSIPRNNNINNNNNNKVEGFMSLVGISNPHHAKLAPRNSNPLQENKGPLIGSIISLSEAMAQKRAANAAMYPENNKLQGKVPSDQNGFHVNEINGFSSIMSRAVANDTEESLSNFAGYRDIFARTNRDGTKQILSDRGTIRGVKNRVRDGIATFLQSKDTKTYSEKEQGRVVVYVTSMGVVRTTFQRCQKVKQILRNLLVKFDERDCYMNRAIQNEIRQRLPQQHLALPQIFLEGQLLGDAEVIEKLNETGELRDLLKPYKSLSVLSTCEKCGGFRMLPCPICNGSKKSVHRNHFTTEFIALKCMHCDPSGLVRCDLCNCVDS